MGKLTIETRVWYTVTSSDEGTYKVAGTVVKVPRHASGNYTVLSDNVSARQRYHERPIDALSVIPKRSLRLLFREMSEEY